ncbi:hypothetical protein [Lewinella sp. 4G2]|uniref:hypothetical protein n=1 Tax=Lewinella sp. 4G2 TaxID=1803372 RepID=UPI0007B4B4E5|nr:hypothetical protein [Lewinella sp. 4G2]OAV45119.1 hypothetical protein A3850_011740 [Lewinella sp. 4G2]
MRVIVILLTLFPCMLIGQSDFYVQWMSTGKPVMGMYNYFKLYGGDNYRYGQISPKIYAADFVSLDTITYESRYRFKELKVTLDTSGDYYRFTNNLSDVIKIEIVDEQNKILFEELFENSPLSATVSLNGKHRSTSDIDTISYQRLIQGQGLTATVDRDDINAKCSILRFNLTLSRHNLNTTYEFCDRNSFRSWLNRLNRDELIGSVIIIHNIYYSCSGADDSQKANPLILYVKR